MKIQNNTNLDRFLFGVHLSKGAVVDVSGLPEDKRSYLAREFDVVPDKPAKNVTSPVAVNIAFDDVEPKTESGLDSEDRASEDRTEVVRFSPARKTRRKRRSRKSSGS